MKLREIGDLQLETILETVIHFGVFYVVVLGVLYLVIQLIIRGIR